MSTNIQQTQPSAEDAPLEFSDDAGEALIELLEELDAINQDPDKSPLNKYSMDDNNGGRIEFIQRLTRKLPVFLFLRRLLYVHPKNSKN
jgi:hypothetical protein